MQTVPAARKIAFVLASTEHGSMILNRLDYRMNDRGGTIGLGLQILDFGSFDIREIKLVLELLQLRRKYHGDGVVAFDCGANIGVHTIDWAKSMTGWGSVIAIEAQERIYYALAGNIAINNCFNAIAVHGAVSSESGVMQIPTPNYLVPGSFGSLELRQSGSNEDIGQKIDYGNLVNVRKLALDEYDLARIDLIKIDVEGMELEVLQGAARSIERSRPVMLIEKIKADAGQLRQWLEAHGYTLLEAGINLLAIHSTDALLPELMPGTQPEAQPTA
jgi:FkbM family methyltransferase